ncbi:MAG: hypothetical protein ACE5G1_13185, partial [bacterium]
YQKSHLFRAITLSFATIKDANATKLGFGLRWIPLDKSDPLMDHELQKDVRSYFEKMEQLKSSAENRRLFLNKIQPFFSRLQPESDKTIVLINLIEPGGSNPPNPLEFETALARLLKRMKEQGLKLTSGQEDTLNLFVSEYIEITKDRQKPITNLIKARKKKFKLNSWNAAVVQIAVGTTWESANSTWKELEVDKFSTFGGTALPISKIGQWIFQGQYMRAYKEEVKEKWRYSLGSRLLLGSSTFRWSLEGLFSDSNSFVPEIDGKSYRFTTGFEFKLSQGLWLEIAAGGNFPRGEGAKSEIISLGNIKYAFQKERRFDIP